MQARESKTAVGGEHQWDSVVNKTLNRLTFAYVFSLSDDRRRYEPAALQR